MRGRIGLMRLAFAGAALAALASGCGRGPGAPAPGGKLRVAASIFPLADLMARVGGGEVEVVTLLPAGTSPHGFEPQPQQVEQLAGCRILLVVGLGVDPWAEQAAKATGSPIRIVRLADLVGPNTAGAEDGHSHHGEAVDPHLWLDPVRMRELLPVLADALAGLDPAHASGYRARGKAFDGELAALDATCRATLAGVKEKAFVSFHPAFTHLAARYGLRQCALTASHAQEGGPAALERVVRFVKEQRIKVVFAEPQFPADRLRWL